MSTPADDPITAGVDDGVRTSIDDAVAVQKLVRLLDRWGAKMIDTHVKGDEHIVEFYPPFPGEQPIRSAITFDGGFEKATIRYGALKKSAWRKHPAKSPDAVRRIVDAAADVTPRPEGMLVLANYGDSHWPPRPHLLLGWRPSMADGIEVVDKGFGDPDPAPGELMKYIRQVGRAYSEEFAAEYADHRPDHPGL